MLEEGAEKPTWRRSDPWMTSLVDLDPTHPRGLLGLAPGRSGACVQAWLRVQSAAFRARITTVAIAIRAPPTPPGCAARCPACGSWSTTGTLSG